VWLVLIVTWLWSKMQAGSLLLVLGQQNKVMMLVGIATVLMVIPIFILGQSPDRFIYGYYNLVSGIYLLLYSLSSLEIREKGIWSHGSLIRWEQIESYVWKINTNITLMVKFKQPLYLSKTRFLRLAILSHNQEPMTRLLRKYLPPASS